jgi:hypothetical protein
MYRCNTKAKIPLNNKQTPKHKRVRMTIGHAKGRALMEGGGLKKEVKKVNMGVILSLKEYRILKSVGLTIRKGLR